VRVPIADVNLLKLPARVPEDAALLLSDVLPTAWHGCELAGVGPGDKVAVWGAGPVSILAAHCAFARGADRVVLIDGNAERLEFAAARIDRLEVLNKNEKKVLAALHEELFPESKGPDW
jgi:threonine dehydrogenase-like Zn-dependent dehydrogenase